MDRSELAIACVLKTGRWRTGMRDIVCDYRPEHVQWLKRQCDQFAPGVRFVCLTNAPKIEGVETIPLKYDWRGWWSKIELFQHDLGRVMYLDLDTVVVGPIDDMIAHPHQFTALQSLTPKPVRSLGSGLMAWSGPRPDIFEPFAKRPEYWMQKCANSHCWGDQGFISKCLGNNWQAWQDLFPGAVGSFKTTWRRKKPPANARIVCFHGKPKPWQVQQEWVPRV
jgi:hypothetical protein